MAFDYQRVKRLLELEKTAPWLKRDAADDFFPDALGLRDIVERPAAYCSERQHRILQLETYQSLPEEVPKSNGMFREAIVLPPAHRLLYLAVLRYFLPKLDPLVSREVYSYRRDEGEDDEYPFPDRANRWKGFANDFRSACLDESTGAVLITDIASFYDHIQIEELISLVRSMLGPRASEDDRAMLDFMKDLLLQWTKNGYGIPQNYDPSSFFGSLYLDPVDKEIVQKRYRYFRWVDDIRVCAKNRRQAERALHDLQRALARYRLFLAANKTKIIEKGDAAFEELVDVSDEQLLAELEEATDAAVRIRIDAVLPRARERLLEHAGPAGDERKFRAYANRILAISDFAEYRQHTADFIVEAVLPRLDTNPAKTDFWVRLLGVGEHTAFAAQILRLLWREPSVHNWQRFHLWRLLIQSNHSDLDLVEYALSLVNNPVSEAEASQAAIYAGKAGSPHHREQLYNHFNRQRSGFLQRGILIGLQEMERERRDKMYGRIAETCREHRELISYLTALASPDYGARSRGQRHLRLQEQVPFTVPFSTGIGKIGGQIVRFRLSRADYDYE